MLYLLYFAPLISLIVTIFATRILIRYLKRIGLVVKDQNKEDKPLVPLSGGLAVMAGILIGLMTYIFILTFLYKETTQISQILAVTTTIILITFIGFMDDIIINKTKDTSVGLRQWQKPLLTLTAAIPLMVINAGTSRILIPFFGVFELGLLYPLVFIPLGVVGASNMVNLLAGINGIETGMGIIYIGSLGLFAYVNKRPVAAAIAAIVFFALLGFFYYNKSPAKILPGDSLTYLLGASLICIAVIGNIEKAAIISSIPFFLEFILKARSKFKAQSYGYYDQGKIHSLHDKIYSLIHLCTRKSIYTEKQIAIIFILVQGVFSGLIWLM